jgi:hypothetical protein
MPTPGCDAPLPDMSRLVQPQTFNLTSTNDTIHITAQATLVNPLPEGLEMTVPVLPFVVSLSANGTTPAVPLAALHSAPLDAQTRPNLTLHLSGALLPLPAADGGGALSVFLARYLSAQDSPVSVSSPLYPGLAVDTLFPAPRPPPRVLRDLALREMRVRALGAGFVVSGTVAARRAPARDAPRARRAPHPAGRARVRHARARRTRIRQRVGARGRRRSACAAAAGPAARARVRVHPAGCVAARAQLAGQP